MEIIFIILAIVAVLSGFLKNDSDNDTRTSRRGNNQPGPTPYPSGRENRSGEMQRGDEPQSTVAESIEVQQYEQRNQLAERMNTMKQNQESEHDANIQHSTRKPEDDLSAEHQKMKKQMTNNLTRTGIINGVIMSEVLGQPRAVKPYRSIVAERKK